MSNLIDKFVSKCGDYVGALGTEGAQIMNSITYERWLVVSALAVVFGFFLLRSNN